MVVVIHSPWRGEYQQNMHQNMRCWKSRLENSFKMAEEAFLPLLQFQLPRDLLPVRPEAFKGLDVWSSFPSEREDTVQHWSHIEPGYLCRALAHELQAENPLATFLPPTPTLLPLLLLSPLLSSYMLCVFCVCVCICVCPPSSPLSP